MYGGQESPCRPAKWLADFAAEHGRPCPYVPLDEEIDVPAELVQWSLAEHVRESLAPSAISALLAGYPSALRYEWLSVARAALTDSRVLRKLFPHLDAAKRPRR